MAPPTVGWALSPQSLIKEMLYRFAYTGDGLVKRLYTHPHHVLVNGTASAWSVTMATGSAPTPSCYAFPDHDGLRSLQSYKSM